MPKKVSLPGVDALFSRREEPTPEGAIGERGAASSEQPAYPDTRELVEDLRPQKFTFYFERETLEALDEAWFALRRRLGQRVSKSAIVDHVVREAVRDLDRVEQLLTGPS